jgi:hypothetical protein
MGDKYMLTVSRSAGGGEVYLEGAPTIRPSVKLTRVLRDTSAAIESLTQQGLQSHYLAGLVLKHPTPLLQPGDLNSRR